MLFPIIISVCVNTTTVPTVVNSQSIDAASKGLTEANPLQTINPIDPYAISDCISASERELANEIIARYRQLHPERAITPVGVLTFFPMGGRLYGDIYT